MKKVNKISCILLFSFLASSCSYNYFVPYPTPHGNPKKKTSIGGGVGIPNNFEIQKKISESLDLQLGISYINILSEDMTPQDQTNKYEYSAALYGGLQGWLLNRDSSVFNLGIGLGAETIKSNIASQFGGRLTLTLGGFWKNYILFISPFAGIGGANKQGRYFYLGSSLQTSFRIFDLRMGLRFGLVAGIGSNENSLLVAYPFEIGLLAIYEF
jgi:hypothetical protein